MADQQSRPNLAALRKLEASLRLDLLEREVNGACANTGMPINGKSPNAKPLNGKPVNGAIISDARGQGVPVKGARVKGAPMNGSRGTRSPG